MQKFGIRKSLAKVLIKKRIGCYWKHFCGKRHPSYIFEIIPTISLGLLRNH